MNHSFACAKDAQKEPACAKWCGNKHTCLSTLTYASPALQEAYEKGHFDAKWAMENELAKMAQTTSPHRRVAAEDFYRVLCKIKPVAFDIMPTAEAPAPGVAAGPMTPENAGQRITDMLMECVERLGNFSRAKVDPRAWQHLLAYLPHGLRGVPLSGERLREIELGLRKYVPGTDRYDLSLLEFARAIEAAHGIGVMASGKPLTDPECWERGLPDSIDRAMEAERQERNAGVATPLSDFIRNASPERKAEVFGRVMDNVTERQQAVIAAAGGVPAVDARAAEVMRLADAFAEASAETARGDDDAKDPVLAREALARALGVLGMDKGQQR